MKNAVLYWSRFLASLSMGVAGCLAADVGTVAETESNETELRIETIHVRGVTMTNVVVSDRGEETVYLKHDGGLIGVKVADLDPETRNKLGYEPEPASKSAGFQLFDLASGLAGTSAAGAGQGSMPAGPPFDPALLERYGVMALAISGAVALGLHLFFSFLLRLICLKAESKPGLLIWIPGLQIFPILRAAGMSWAWPFAVIGLSVAGVFLVGVAPDIGLALSCLSSLAGLVLWIIWSVKICTARGKSPALAILLLVPLLNVAGLIYLAASE